MGRGFSGSFKLPCSGVCFVFILIPFVFPRTICVQPCALRILSGFRWEVPQDACRRKDTHYDKPFAVSFQPNPSLFVTP